MLRSLVGSEMCIRDSPQLWDPASQRTVGPDQKRARELSRRVTAFKRKFKSQGVDLPLKHHQGCTYLLGQRKLVLSYSGERLLVRTGGGWGDLEEMLERFTMEDQKKVLGNRPSVGRTRIHGENSAYSWQQVLRNSSNTTAKGSLSSRRKDRVNAKAAWQLGNVELP
eukprot:TRINITY_DN12542_c0_g1_i2.p1 TRINITY_DN12542_c0_g1~~TRINITY_DN12542_c0_g1_i2.p1  ORF type:complete len:167 (+),score=48.02 TRINITY_DN12542_c0_g1_i2:110-610(+)